MDLLPVGSPIVLDRAIAAEVGDGRERSRREVVGRRPAVEDHRRERLDPVKSARRDFTVRRADRSADSYVMRVAVEAAVDAICVPELVEGRIQVEVDAQGDAGEQFWRKCPRDVKNEVKFASPIAREVNLVPQALEAEHILKDSPLRATLALGGRGRRDEDPQSPTSSSIRRSTRSESKYSSAIFRAARACLS